MAVHGQEYFESVMLGQHCEHGSTSRLGGITTVKNYPSNVNVSHFWPVGAVVLVGV